MILVRERRGSHIEDWMADVEITGPPELRGFSRNYVVIGLLCMPASPSIGVPVQLKATSTG
jgi:hypothetical protein